MRQALGPDLVQQVEGDLPLGLEGTRIGWHACLLQPLGIAGPHVSPRTFPPAPGWSAGGHRIKAPLEYARGPDKAWVYGGLRVRDGQAVTFTARSRNTTGYLDLLRRLDRANPKGDLYIIADNLSSHTSGPIQAWFAERPRVHPVPLPVGACWLNSQEDWWRLLRLDNVTFWRWGAVGAVMVRVAAWHEGRLNGDDLRP